MNLHDLTLLKGFNFRLTIFLGRIYARSLKSNFSKNLKLFNQSKSLVSQQLTQFTGLSIFGYTLTLAIGCLGAARTMHITLLRSSLHWSLSFFDTTPIGRVLNRFSNDIYVLDLTLPQLLQASIQTCFTVIIIENVWKIPCWCRRT